MDYEIIRGRNQIGGTITEIRNGNHRIWIDFGMELSTKDPYATDEQVVKQMRENPPDAVLFTHIHGDHIGLLYAVPTGVRVYLGPVALKMMKNIRETLLGFGDLEQDEREKLQAEMNILSDDTRLFCYKNKEPMDVFGVKVTPFLVDHSVADAYMLRLEAEGKCIVHTGDFRNHGRQGETLLNMLKEEVASVPVHVLITEGTMMSRTSKESMSEKQMEAKAQEVLERNKYAFLVCSSTNMESLASFYWAMVRAGKKRKEKPPFIVNSYVKKQLELFTNTEGASDWRFRFHRSYPIHEMLNHRLKNGRTQKQQMIDEGFVMMVGTSEYYRGLMEEFREYNPVLFYSLWDGYLDEKEGYANEDLISLVNAWKGNVVKLHTSGHASPETVARVIETINPIEKIVPVHTENVKGFKELDIAWKYKRMLEEDHTMEENEYQRWARKVDAELENDPGWIDVYRTDAAKMKKNMEKIAKARKMFRVRKPLSVYITIGNASAGNPVFDLRYLGQSVGTIKVKMSTNEVLLSAKDKMIRETEEHYFGYSLGAFSDKDWHKSKKAKEFRRFYKEYATGKPRQDEHRVEEALFSEFEKSSGSVKHICGITPVKYENIRFHMMTALAACKSKEGIVHVSDKYRGGDIDILCRRNKSLAVIEVKDEYREDESFELAIKQAISYAVFLRKVVRSEIGMEWMKIWGLGNQYKEKMKIYAVAAMPYTSEDQIPDFSKIPIVLGNDTIELRCIAINKEKVDGKSGNVECKWV